MNIIWNKPEGTIAITHLTSECMEQMQRAAEYLALEKDKQKPSALAAAKQFAAFNGLTIEEHAAALKAGGRVPPDWDAVAFDATLPVERVFRDAFAFEFGAVVVDLPRAKEVAHSFRRMARDKEFEPLDRLSTVPGKAAQVEVARQAIRDKYAAAQARIDAAADVGSLMVELGLFYG